MLTLKMPPSSRAKVAERYTTNALLPIDFFQKKLFEIWDNRVG